MIYYSQMNPIDMCPTLWSFNDSTDQFYNWKNTPTSRPMRMAQKQAKLQLYAEDDESNNTFTLSQKVVNSETGEEIAGLSYFIEVPTLLPGKLYEVFIDFSIVPNFTILYVELEIDYGDDRADVLRSSCHEVVPVPDEKIIKIEFSNTINDRFINGMLFTEGSSYYRYLFANKYDTEVNVIDDETQNDFQGNSTLIEKTHAETDIYEIATAAKKAIMSVIAVSENDIIYVNGRRANITFEKVTESQIGAFEIPYMSGLLRVTYADNNGLLDVKNDSLPDYLLINDIDKMLINTGNYLKNR